MLFPKFRIELLFQMFSGQAQDNGCNTAPDSGGRHNCYAKPK